MSGPQIGLIIWTTRGGCEKQILGLLPGDSDSVNWGSTVCTALYMLRFFTCLCKFMNRLVKDGNGR